MILGLFTGLAAAGGVERAGLLVAEALASMADARGDQSVFLSLNDRDRLLELDGSEKRIEILGFNRNKLRFALHARRKAKGARMIYVSHPNLAPVAVTSRMINGVGRFVVACHGTEVWSPLPLVRRMALRRMDVVTAPSEFTAARVRAVQLVTASKIRVLPWCVHPMFLQEVPVPGETANRPLQLLSVARLSSLERQKGIDVVLVALPKLLQEIGRVSYVVVGGGDDLPRLKMLAHELGVASYTNFLGEIGDRDLIQQYLASDIFVLPSEQEGFGVAFLEAMACGKPVIAANAGSAPEIVEHMKTGLLVPPRSSDEVASAIVKLATRPMLVEQLARAARAKIDAEYRFSVLRAALNTLVSELLEE